MNEPSTSYPATWRERWSRLSRAAGLDPREAVVVALSGGADSVLLLHWLCASHERPDIVAVHVQHGLRGAESDEDARFCARLCRDMGVRFRLRDAPLELNAPSLEERARLARYAVLVDEARRAHMRVILTAHHADDGLESVLMRWIRGSDLAGLTGPEPSAQRGDPGEHLLVVRPLLGLRRAEIRRLMSEAGLEWRDDSSNLDPRFSRNRVREVLLPKLAAVAGPAALENLREFARAVEDLERTLSSHTANLVWSPMRATRATRASGAQALGGTLRRAQVVRLPAALQRRALWRLVLEGTSRAPSRRLLDVLLQDLDTGRCVRRSLPGGWSLQMRAAALELHPPLDALAAPRNAAVHAPWLPFAELAGATGLPPTRESRWLNTLAAPVAGFALPLPGSVTLPDGRRIVATLLDAGSERAVPRGADTVELDAAELPAQLAVRWPRPGDRFHAFGAPGSRALRRFLADAGVPRSERRLVPLVVVGAELLWVAGLRPSEARRLGPGTTRRLRLELHSGARRANEVPHTSARTTREVQLELWPNERASRERASRERT